MFAVLMQILLPGLFQQRQYPVYWQSSDLRRLDAVCNPGEPDLTLDREHKDASGQVIPGECCRLHNLAPSKRQNYLS